MARKELRSLLLDLELENLTLADRERRWKLAAFLAKELGSALEEPQRLHPLKGVEVDRAPARAVDI